MSPTLNESFALQSFERGNVLEIRNGIMFYFYPGLPHMHLYLQVCRTFVCTHAHTHTRTYTHMHIHTHARTHTRMHTHTYTHTQTHTHIHTLTFSAKVREGSYRPPMGLDAAMIEQRA